jgi:hypothetical protein
MCDLTNLCKSPLQNSADGFDKNRKFITHQRKGGIHAIYRIFVETFGWFRLTGFYSTKENCDAKRRMCLPGKSGEAF